MIQTEFFGVVAGMNLHRTWSDDGMMLEQDGTGILYNEAIDPDFMNRSYTETDIPIEKGWGETIPDPDEGWGETLPDPEEGESLEELGVPEEGGEPDDPPGWGDEGPTEFLVGTGEAMVDEGDEF